MRADDQLISDTVEPRTSMPIRGINSDRNIGHSLSTRTLRAPLPWLMGHSTIQMTMRYSHLVPKVNQVAVDAMDAFYEGGSGSGTGTDTRTDTGTTVDCQQSSK